MPPKPKPEGEGQWTFRVAAGGSATTMRTCAVRITAHKPDCTSYDKTMTFPPGTSGSDVATAFSNDMASDAGGNFDSDAIGKSLFVDHIDKFDGSSSNDAIRVTFGYSGRVKWKDINDPPDPKESKSRKISMDAPGPRQDGEVWFAAASLSIDQDANKVRVMMATAKPNFSGSESAAEALERVQNELVAAGWASLPQGSGFSPLYTSDGAPTSTLLVSPDYPNRESDSSDHWSIRLE